MSCLRDAIRSAPRKEAPNAPGRRARADRDGLAGPSRHAPLSTGMSALDFDPLGPIQARIAVACSGARWDGALLGLSGEGRRRTSAWVLGVSLMPPLRRLRRGAPARGWRITTARQRRFQGPRLTVSALATAIPNSL